MKKLISTLTIIFLVVLSLSLVNAEIFSNSVGTGITVVVSGFPSASTKIGDADMNGVIETEDAEIIANIAAGNHRVLGSNCNVDVDNNGRVDVLDSLLTAQMAEGILPERGTCGARANQEPNRNTEVGDADLDGDVDEDDARLIANYAAGLIPLPEDICHLDANGDGQVTILDSLIVSQVAEGLRGSLGICRDNEGEGENGGSSNDVNSNDVEVERIIVNQEYVQAGDVLQVSADVDTDLNLKDVRVRATIPELGITKSGRYFDLRDEDEVDTITMDIPVDAVPGDYILRVYVSDNDSEFHRIKHRIITVY